MDVYFDRGGVPISADQWAQLHRRDDYRRMARTTVTSAADPAVAYDVSTVWLGIDHSFGGPLPVIFETMVFGDDANDLDVKRYSTEADAGAGHTEMVVVVAATVDDPIVMHAEGNTT